MKITRSIITTVFITLSAFTAIIYTSCNNSCAHLTCFNGGSCSSGFCTCPYGYTGNSCEIPNTSNIQYYNHSLTPITITLNNVAYTIPPKQIKGFSGLYGDSLKGNAFTNGTYGETITWDSINNTFPISGTLLINLDISPKYYFLEVYNDSSSSKLREIDVNVGLPTERDIIIPSPFIVYGTTVEMGYFFDSSGTTAASNVHIKSTTNSEFVFPAGTATSLSLPMTQDQAFEVTVP